MKFESMQVFTKDDGIPVIKECDVLVAGGGPAGTSAAETIARNGYSVVVIEKLGFMGGAAVSGMSGTICGLFEASKNHNRAGVQLVFGFAEKFVERMKKEGGLSDLEQYGHTYVYTHDPQVWKEVSEDIVLETGAEILYHSSVTGVIMDGDEFCGVVADSTAGVGAIMAKRFIDATGDATLVFRAGLPCTKGEDGKVQNTTMIFRLGGVDIERFNAYWGKDTIAPKFVSEAFEKAEREEGYMLPRKSVWVFHPNRPGELLMNVTRVIGRNGQDLDVTDPFDHSEAEQIGRKQARQYARFFKEHVPGCKNSYIVDMAPEVGVRQTITVTGVEKLVNDDIINAKKHRDGILKCAWPVELHCGDKPTINWLFEDYYESRYLTLVPVKGENIIVAGRNFSAQHEALASCRTTAQCFAMGEAAGLATVISLEKNLKYRDIDGAEVRARLNNDGARLD